MPKRIDGFDPTATQTGEIHLSIPEGSIIELWNESNVVLSFETTYGDFYTLSAGFIQRFKFGYTVTDLDWAQLFTLDGIPPTVSRVYGLKYSPTESKDMVLGPPVPIIRQVGINGGSLNALTTATALMNIGDPALRSAIIRIINSSSLSDNFYVDNAGGVTVRDQNGNVLLQTHVAALPGSLELGSILSPVLISGLLTIAGMLSAGGIPYVDATSHIVDDAANLFWDAVNKRLGIGNNAPSVPLDVTGNIKASGTIAGTNLPATTVLSGAFSAIIPASGTVAIRDVANNFLALITATGGINVGALLRIKQSNVAGSATLTVANCVVVCTDTTVARTFTMPNANIGNGAVFIIKDGTGGAATHNITVNPAAASAQTFDGASSYVINTNWGVVRLISDGANWLVI